MRFEDLRDALGGDIHVGDHRMWLDTRVGGLRTFVIRRVVGMRADNFEVAVFSPGVSEVDPFREPVEGVTLLDGERAIPRLEPPFVFTGFRGGVLFATTIDEPSLEGMVTTLWRLADLARRVRSKRVARPPLTWRARWRADIRYWWQRWADWIQLAFLLVCILGAIASC